MGYLFRYQGHIGAYLVLGGYDCNGPHLYSIHAHASVDRLPYMTMGSGSLAAMAVFESKFQPNMEKEAAMALVAESVMSGMSNDLFSGNNLDMCIVTKDGMDYRRGYNFETKFRRELPRLPHDFKKGTTTFLTEETSKHGEEGAAASGEAMDTAWLLHTHTHTHLGAGHITSLKDRCCFAFVTAKVR